mmetsp:Transcript_20010/g.58476  ORF Transcript_20010/g.58476 Transcript_20010/m.58476 type:complete len:217 (-) Transcript_20010:621-1271(-)
MGAKKQLLEGLEDERRGVVAAGRPSGSVQVLLHPVDQPLTAVLEDELDRPQPESPVQWCPREPLATPLVFEFTSLRRAVQDEAPQQPACKLRWSLVWQVSKVSERGLGKFTDLRSRVSSTSEQHRSDGPRSEEAAEGCSESQHCQFHPLQVGQARPGRGPLQHRGFACDPGHSGPTQARGRWGWVRHEQQDIHEGIHKPRGACCPRTRSHHCGGWC